MKAIVCPRYGTPDVLELQEVPQPVPKGDEVLVKVHAVSINVLTLQEVPAALRHFGSGRHKGKVVVSL